MQHSLLRVRLHLPALFLLVLSLSVVLTGHAHAQSSPDQQLKTKYFTIFYPKGEEDTASWYASFADDVSAAVSEMLGQEPVAGLTLRIYTTEAEYIAANPAAGDEPGIMAHAVPSELEVGVAVERLRQVEPNVARESFRHEMTHIVAGALSKQNLPIGFQEALAQYNELSTSRAQESMSFLKSALASKVALMSWEDLNDPGVFMQSAALGYPESYSVMAFLADKYGMGAFGRFMSDLSEGISWKSALQDAYEKPVTALEAEWREYLPTFLKDGWQQNLLTAYDLSPGVAFYDAGHFTEAREHFTKSQKLYADLGRAERADAAAALLAKAEKAEGALNLAGEARKSLEAYGYAVAHSKATDAVQTFTELDLPTQVEPAKETLGLAQEGLDAIAMLTTANDHLNNLDLPGARSEARYASETFAKLGDTVRAAEANKIVSSLSLAFTLVGLATAGIGLLALLGGGYAMVRARRAASLRLPGEESASWL